MKKFHYKLTGVTDLIMNRDDVDHADAVKEWTKTPEGKGGAAGDDRSPAWKWTGCLYRSSDDANIAMPTANIIKCLIKAGSRIILKKTTTYKEAVASLVTLPGTYHRFLVGGKEVSVADILALKDRPFEEQAAHAMELGFKLLVKRATVGSSKHIRVRPMFGDWSVEGEGRIMDESVIKNDILDKVFEGAGYLGLGDWRPSSPKSPGSYGMFTAKLKF